MQWSDGVLHEYSSARECCAFRLQDHTEQIRRRRDRSVQTFVFFRLLLQYSCITGDSMQNQHDRGRRDGDFFLSTPTEVENELPFQLFGAGCDFYQYAIERPFGFPVYQWIQTIRGTGVLATQGTELPVGANEGMLLFPDEAHRYHSVD